MAAKSSQRDVPLKSLANREFGQGTQTWNSDLMAHVFNNSENLYRKDLYTHYGCVNAIEFSNDGEWLISGGDDRRVVLWNVEKAIQGTGKPSIMKGEHNSNIFCLGFDNENSKIFSAGNDEQVIVHDSQTGASIDVFLHEEAVYGLSIDPLNSNVFASACDDGRVLIWDIRAPSSSDPFCLASYSSAFHAVMYNPVESRLLACANSREGMSLWDIRNAKSCYMKYIDDGLAVQSCMSVRFSSDGTKILALRRRLPPVLYDIGNPVYTYQFDCPGYYNICTMKSCCFAGERDQYVLSGSDDFNLYVWEVPKEDGNRNTSNPCSKTLVDETHMILKGHRSIVNQVRFNTHNFLLASSGVEKIIKLWSPFALPKSTGGLTKECSSSDKERKIFTHEEYINLVMRSGQVMTHDYTHQSTKEDPRMMAFFDSLVQREIEGLNTDSNQSGVNSDSWLFNVVDGFSVSDADSSSISSADSDSVTVVSGDRTSDMSGDRAPSPSREVADREFPLDLGRSSVWQRSSEGLPSPIISLSPSVSSSSEKNDSCNVKSTDEDENDVHSSERFQSWTSSSIDSLSLLTSDTISSSENDRDLDMCKYKKGTKLPVRHRRKILKKRKLPPEEECSDFDSDDQLSYSKSKKLPYLKLRQCQLNKSDSISASSSSVATTSSDMTGLYLSSKKKKSEEANKSSTVVCVAAQNSDINMCNENNCDVDVDVEEEVREATTPDSGIASRSFDNEKPSPSNSTCDSSERDNVKSKKTSFKARGEKLHRSRVYRKTSHQDSD